MSDRLNRNSVSWKPSPGDIVEGRLLDVELYEGKFGSYPLMNIETETGDVVGVHCFHTVLRSEMGRKRPAPGDQVAIKFVGTEPGKSYASYKLVVERATPAPPIDYDAMARDAAADQAIDSAFEEPLPEAPDYGDEY